MGGAATGFGADLIIVDDLMKAADAASPVERERVKTYYEQTLLSRLNDKVNGRIVAILQRLHEDDLAGYLSLSGQFDHLNLPAFAVRRSTSRSGLGKRIFGGRTMCCARSASHRGRWSGCGARWDPSASRRSISRIRRRRVATGCAGLGLELTMLPSPGHLPIHRAELGYGPVERDVERLLGWRDGGAVRGELAHLEVVRERLDFLTSRAGSEGELWPGTPTSS